MPPARLVNEGRSSFDDVIERRVLGRQYHTQFQFSALALAFTYNTLNLPLRGNADRVKELALGDVEAILVHFGLHNPGYL